MGHVQHFHLRKRLGTISPQDFNCRYAIAVLESVYSWTTRDIGGGTAMKRLSY